MVTARPVVEIRVAGQAEKLSCPCSRRVKMKGFALLNAAGQGAA
jgi:hypothetical protein